MLNSRPARNQALKWEKDDEGEVSIILSRKKGWRMNLMAKIFYIPEQRKISLDEIGSEIWAMCNGRTPVAKMIEAIGEKYKLNPKEAEISLLSYLRTLGKKRVIGFLVKDEQTPRKSGSRKK